MPIQSPGLYGLSTEGVNFIKKNYARSFPVIDESLRLTVATIDSNLQIELNSKRELSDILPATETLSKIKEIFFAPKVKKWGQDWWEEILHHVKFIGNSISQGQQFINLVPVALGKNEQLINTIETVSGLSVGKDFGYHYMPIPVSMATVVSVWDGTPYEWSNGQVSLEEGENGYLIRSVSNYLKLFEEVWLNRSKSVFVSDYSRGIFPLTLSLESFERGSSIHGISHVLLKSSDDYINQIVNDIKFKLREENIKPARAIVYVIWELDDYELFNEAHYLRAKLVSRLEEHFGEIIPLSLKKMENLTLNYSISRESIILACTKVSANALLNSEVSKIVVPGVI